MSRTRVFVSYSHADREWLKRFSQHIAVLERQGLVDLWSDKRIDIGTLWEVEIERALTAAQVAVLLVSPAFLASDFIWKREMPRISAHSTKGMKVFPLIARPCAWKLEKELSRLQARPLDGRALSLGSDSQVDLDLSEFVYAIAAQIGRSPAVLEPSDSEVVTGGVDDLVGYWGGYYYNGARPIRLLVRKVDDCRFDGKMVYLEDGTITNVEGTVHKQWSVSDRLWAQVGSASDNGQDLALSFRETGYEIRGGSPISFDGEYRTLVRGDKMAGAWFSADRLVGTLALSRANDLNQFAGVGAEKNRSNRPTQGLKRMPSGTA